ncbi:MAG: hypothetical protein NT084_11480 [Bacteroidetes bacterium]|nr:hypothetical protein [Bacteroidota bacterium]
MDFADKEIIEFWKSLHIHEVKYILVGGFAVNLHGYSRNTADLDLWIRDDAQNRKNFRVVIKEIGIGDFESLETTQFIPGGSTLLFNSGFELDVMTFLSGFPADSFDDAYAKASIAAIHEIPVRFLHLNQLIEAKKTCGRPRDIQDIIELERISREK